MLSPVFDARSCPAFFFFCLIPCIKSADDLWLLKRDVTDASGAAAPGATVTLTSTALQRNKRKPRVIPGYIRS